MSQFNPAVKKNRFWPVFHRYGWICLFWAGCFACYFHAMHKKSQVSLELQEKIADLESLKSLMERESEELALQIQSQNDPEWIEMVLKKRLGVVPEGQMKVYFKRDE